MGLADMQTVVCELVALSLTLVLKVSIQLLQLIHLGGNLLPDLRDSIVLLLDLHTMMLPCVPMSSSRTLQFSE